MISKLKNGKKVVGLKQTRRAAAQGLAAMVWVAKDADPAITAPIHQTCEENMVPCDEGLTMKELGSACGISVGASAAALLKE